MSNRSCFENDESYVQVLAHELIHSSGSAKRLKRKGVVEPIRFGSETYGFEELIGELGSAFLCSDHSIELNIPRTAAYVEGWLSALKNDKSMIVKAACKAQKAVDYLSGTHCVRA
jgi:antirestriction protein ArdC